MSRRRSPTADDGTPLTRGDRLFVSTALWVASRVYEEAAVKHPRGSHMAKYYRGQAVQARVLAIKIEGRIDVEKKERT